MVLGKLPLPGRPTILITVGQGPFSLNIFYFNKCHFYTDLIYTYSIGLERKLTLIWFFAFCA